MIEITGFRDLRQKVPINAIREYLLSMEFAQNQMEFLSMLRYVINTSSLLEVGSRFGESLHRMGMCMKPSSLIVSVDWPNADNNKELDSEVSLRENAQRLHSVMGHTIYLLLGDSHSQEMIDTVRRFAPFDFCFIDGDHSYEGAKKDWLSYGPMSKIVGFHDICGPVKQLWDEIKQGRKCVEFTDSGVLGIGVLFN